MVDVGAAPIDRYVVLEHLSEGGMGAIYVGKKLGAGGFEMEVVLKQLLPEFTQQEEFIDLFLREAKLSATLDHANIVHTIDLVTAGNEYFIVMEYLAGGDLRTLLKRAKRRGKRFSPASAIYICREVLSALSYAHVKRDLDGVPLKLIHRDVSPSNILVSTAGEVKLTDFGIAKAATHNSLFYKVKGKIGYMSPEQAKSEPLDHRSDLYSLAVCLYEVLTGERLFVHAGLTTSADEIYSQPVPQVSRKVAGLTPDLDAIMSKALALSPGDRFQTAGEFQEALTRCAHRNGLLISAPEVARELLDRCGPPEQWRDTDDDEDFGYARRAGTEVYDGGADEDDEGSMHGMLPPRPPSGPLPLSPRTPSGPLPAVGARSSSSRISRPPRTEQHKLQGVVELTSIINMIDLENQHREQMGERPLVDLDAGPRPQPRPSPLAPLAPVLHASQPSIAQAMPSQAMPPQTMPAQAMPAQAMRAHAGPPQTMPPQAIPPQTMPAQAMPAPPMPARSTRGLAAVDARGAVDPGDMLPTAPRALPTPAVEPTRVPQYQAAPIPAAAIKKKSWFRPWMVIVLIILAAAIAGIVIAMSGPDVDVQHGK